MFAKKISYLTISSLFMTSAFAANNSDLQLNFGLTDYDNFTDTSSDIKFKGINYGITYLYSFLDSKVTPVLGGGINVHRVNYSGSLGDRTLQSSDVILKVGAKINITEKFNLFALLHSGYAYYNSLTTPLIKGHYDLKNTFSYGSSLIGSFSLSENINLGIGYTYNRRTMNEKNVITSYDAQYNENSFNVILGYSF